MQRTLLTVSLLGPLLHAGWAAQTNRFGFSGPEIFPIDNGISQLRSADLDGDGLNDLVFVNNARSKITLLYNQTGKTNTTAEPKPFRSEINELPPDARFRLDSIASEKRISSMVVTDLNGDGRADIAYYGEPKELVVQYNQGTNGWSALKKWPIDDGLLNPNALTEGDLNGDDRPDLVLLAEGHLYALIQQKDHTLGEPQRIPYSGAVLAEQVLDVDGDGRDDLLLVNWDSSTPFRVRLQNSSGQLGPEMHFEIPPIRSYWADDLDGDHKTEVITIAQNSGRAQIWNFSKKKAESLTERWKRGQFQVLPLKKTSKAKRGMVWADINRDERPDLLVAEPDSGQLTVFLQNEDGTLSASKTFPTLTGVSDLAVSDWDDDGTPEIFLLSSDERQVGVTRFDDKGGIGFPEMRPLPGRPLAMAVGRLGDEKKPVLAVIVDRDGKRELHLQMADGTDKHQALSESFKSNPVSMAIHDADQDGLSDLVVLIPYEKIKVLRQVKDKDEFEELDVAPPGGMVDQPWMTRADVDGDGKQELLLAQRNFLRAVVLDRSSGNGSGAWSFNVKEQINGAGSNSRIVGATAIQGGTNRTASIFLLDAERKVLTLSERDDSGVWDVVRNIPLPVTGFDSVQATSIGAKEENSVAFLGLNSVAWLDLHGEIWDLEELDGYETPIRDGYLTDVVSGDLNQDKRKDLVFLETAKNYLDIVTFEPPHQLIPANRWQVFEERTFRNRRNDRPEPREALITDLTGDKKNDLAVIVHDRVLVYPQE